MAQEVSDRELDLRRQLTEIDKAMAETAQARAQAAKLEVEMAHVRLNALRIEADTKQAQAQTAKIEVERRYYPAVLLVGGVSGGIAFGLALGKLLSLF
ncbi:MAG: hypothetical protein AAGI34_17020 [Pseudomonadota bacterium]